MLTPTYLLMACEYVCDQQDTGCSSQQPQVSVITRVFRFLYIEPVINTYILDLISLSLLAGCILHSFKVVVIQSLVKKPIHDSDALATYEEWYV